MNLQEFVSCASKTTAVAGFVFVFEVISVLQHLFPISSADLVTFHTPSSSTNGKTNGKSHGQTVSIAFLGACQVRVRAGRDLFPTAHGLPDQLNGQVLG